MTTSHKSSYDIQQWENIFSRRGIKNVKIGKLRKNINHLNRREEVMTWATKSPENSFVIIDDNKTLNKLPSELRSRLVQPCATVGLNEELADSAINILKSSKTLAE